MPEPVEQDEQDDADQGGRFAIVRPERCATGTLGRDSNETGPAGAPIAILFSICSMTFCSSCRVPSRLTSRFRIRTMDMTLMTILKLYRVVPSPTTSRKLSPSADDRTATCAWRSTSGPGPGEDSGIRPAGVSAGSASCPASSCTPGTRRRSAARSRAGTRSSASSGATRRRRTRSASSQSATPLKWRLCNWSTPAPGMGITVPIMAGDRMYRDWNPWLASRSSAAMWLTRTSNAAAVTSSDTNIRSDIAWRIAKRGSGARGRPAKRVPACRPARAASGRPPSAFRE